MLKPTVHTVAIWMNESLALWQNKRVGKKEGGGYLFKLCLRSHCEQNHPPCVHHQSITLFVYIIKPLLDPDTLRSSIRLDDDTIQTLDKSVDASAPEGRMLTHQTI